MAINYEERGYSWFKVKEESLAIYELEDKTLIELKADIRNVLFVSDVVHGSLTAVITSTPYTTKELRLQNRIDPLQNIKFELIEEGMTVIEVNRFMVTTIPVLVQVNRTHLREPTGDIHYQINVTGKYSIDKL